MVLQFLQFGESARISRQLKDMDSPGDGPLVRDLIALWEPATRRAVGIDGIRGEVAGKATG
jgi:hypothetical protein